MNDERMWIRSLDRSHGVAPVDVTASVLAEIRQIEHHESAPALAWFAGASALAAVIVAIAAAMELWSALADPLARLMTWS